MSNRLDPIFLKNIKEYGAVGIDKCFNCGNCTATCPLATDEYPFPRNVIRRIQVGQKDYLVHQLDPWLCYYCGDCSATCPKGAEPGETMMAARRWLISQYDWTGLSHKVYTSKAWSIATLIIGALLVIVLAWLLHGPLVTDHVELNTFAPVELIHFGDLVLAGILGFFILTNLLRMFLFAFRQGGELKIPPISVFIKEAWVLIYHVFTQNRFSKCNNKTYWISHIILVYGYLTMFVLIVVFLTWFQTDNYYPLYHPQRSIGYLAALAIIYGSAYALWGRIQKKEQITRFSQISDWLFPILLILLAVSGLMISAFRYLGQPMATYYTYVFHLVVMMQLYICIGPMGKWSHLFYRPFAVYFQAVKSKASELSTSQEALASAGAD